MFTRILNDAPSPENIHELRKAVKYHWYHGRLLAKVRPKWMSRYNASVKRIADILGEHNDVAALRVLFLKHPERYGTYHEVRELLKLIDRRQQELWQQAEPLGHLIFLEKPKYIERRMLEDWERWKTVQAQQASRDVDAELSAAGMIKESAADADKDTAGGVISDVSEKGEPADVDDSGSSQTHKSVVY
ncbi:MAG: CHAD domain-containing protein [Gammaproteobacteria bacterium]|nr:CHAD domain-containing protein [Gammaproteobacteria bacterium]